MSVGEISKLFSDCIYYIVLISAPPLLVATVVGLIISIVQAATSIQEQTITFVPKILAILIVVVILFSWMTNVLGEYTVQLFSRIPEIVRS